MTKRIMTLCAAMAIGATTLLAKEMKIINLTTQPQMHCSNCENRIKSNIRFEKGVKKIETSVKEQRVSLTYDPDKTTPDKLIAALAKIGFTATVHPTDTIKK